MIVNIQKRYILLLAKESLLERNLDERKIRYSTNREEKKNEKKLELKQINSATQSLFIFVKEASFRNL